MEGVWGYSSGPLFFPMKCRKLWHNAAAANSLQFEYILGRRCLANASIATIVKDSNMLTCDFGIIDVQNLQMIIGWHYYVNSTVCVVISLVWVSVSCVRLPGRRSGHRSNSWPPAGQRQVCPADTAGQAHKSQSGQKANAKNYSKLLDNGSDLGNIKWHNMAKGKII